MRSVKYKSTWCRTRTSGLNPCCTFSRGPTPQPPTTWLCLGCHFTVGGGVCPPPQRGHTAVLWLVPRAASCTFLLVLFLDGPCCLLYKFYTDSFVGMMNMVCVCVCVCGGGGGYTDNPCTHLKARNAFTHHHLHEGTHTFNIHLRIQQYTSSNVDFYSLRTSTP